VMVFISIYLWRLSLRRYNAARYQLRPLLRITRGAAGGDTKMDHNADHNVLKWATMAIP
jgi:hypothetical protein